VNGDRAIIVTQVRRVPTQGYLEALIDAEYARATAHCQTCSGRGGLHDPACEHAERVEAAA
jgi:hypothetical protein